MDWIIIGIIGLFLLGVFGKASEANEKNRKKQQLEDEVQLRKKRAEEARSAILASGDKDMIARLRLMEAGFDERRSSAAATPAASAPVRSGPSALGTAAAVAGGMVVGNAVSGAIVASQLENAFADISADLEADLSDASTELASISDELGETDFDFDI
jgi:hypothetical protein